MEMKATTSPINLKFPHQDTEMHSLLIVQQGSVHAGCVRPVQTGFVVLANSQEL